MFLKKICGNFVSKCVPLISPIVVPSMAIHTSTALASKIARYSSGKEMRKTVGAKSDGITGTDTVDIDAKRLVPFPIDFLFHSFVIISLHSFLFSVNISSDFQTAIYQINYSPILHSKTYQLFLSK